MGQAYCLNILRLRDRKRSEGAKAHELNDVHHRAKAITRKTVSGFSIERKRRRSSRM